MRILRSLYPVVGMVALALFCFRKILATPGAIGRTWDWGLPLYPDQIREWALAPLYCWHGYFETGIFHYLNGELFYRLLILPFASAGGAALSKGIPIALLVVAGVTAFRLASRGLGLSRPFAFLAAALYMCSPYTYSRIIAGHLPLLAGHALLPELTLALLVLNARLRDKGRIHRRAVVGAGVFYGVIFGVHPSLLMCAAVIVLILGASALLGRAGAWRVLAAYGAVGALVLLVNAFWIVPMVQDQLGSGAIRHGYDASVTVDSQLEFRRQYLDSVSLPADRLLSIMPRTGMDTEYVFPFPSWLPGKSLVMVLVALAFAAPFAVGADRRRPVLVLASIGLTGGYLMTGTQSLPGMLFYNSLLIKVPLMYSGLSNSCRWLPLFILVVCVLFPVTAQALRARLIGPARSWLAVAVCAVTAACCAPFLTGDFMVPVVTANTIQQMRLIVKDPPPSDEQVIDYIAGRPEPLRYALLPPPALTWCGDTDHALPWNNIFWGRQALFPSAPYHPLADLAIKDLFSWQSQGNAARYLGLASVKYVVVPHYDSFVSYSDYLPFQEDVDKVDGFKDHAPLMAHSLPMQRGLSRAASFGDITVYENALCVPRLFVPTGITLSRSAHDLSALEMAEEDRPAAVSMEGMAPEAASGLEAEADGLSRAVGSIGVSLQRVSPARYLATVTGAVEPFMLVFNESFSGGWQARMGGGGNGRGVAARIRDWANLWGRDGIPVGGHCLVNGFANAWVVRPDGRGDALHLVIEFVPQTLYALSTALSILVLAAGVLFLLATWPATWSRS